MPTFSNTTGLSNQFDFKEEAAKMKLAGATGKQIGSAKTANTIGASFGAVEGVLGAIAPAKKVLDGITMSKSKKMDSKGNITHKPDALGNTLGMAGAGYNIGKNFGPWGAAIGAVGGALIGGMGTLLDKPPSFDDVLNKRNSFDLGIATQAIKGEDTYAKQQLMAKDGMDIQGGVKQIEVERDELVLRKNGKAFKVVADFKGGKTHGQGGEQFVAKEGDIIFPGKDRGKITRLINNKRWSAVETARLALPTDNPKKVASGEYTTGTKGVSTKATTTKNLFGMSKINTQNYIYNKLVKDGGFSDIAAKAMVINLTYESGQFTKHEEAKANKKGTKGIGLAQWTGARRELFEKWFSDNKKNTSSLDDQLEFLLYEFKEHPKNTGVTIEELNKFTDLSAATTEVTKKYENPEDKHQTPAAIKGRENMSKEFTTQKEIPVVDAPIIEKDMGILAPPEKTTAPIKPSTVLGHNETYLKERQQVINAATKNKRSKEDIATAVAAHKTNFEANLNAAALKKEKEQKALEADPGFYNRARGKGKAVAERNSNRAVEVKNVTDAMLRVQSLNFGKAGEFLVDGAVKVGLATYDRFTDKDIQEVGFTDPKLAAQAENFRDFLEGNVATWRRVLGEFEGVDAIRNKILFGADLEGAAPAMIGNLMAGLDTQEANKLISMAKSKGLLDSKGEYFVRDAYNNPQDYYTTQMGAGMVLDVGLLIANPKGALSAIKGIGGTLVAGGKLTIDGVKYLASAPIRKGLMAAIKKAPALARKLGDTLLDATRETYKYSGAEDMDAIAKTIKEVTSTGAKISPEKLTWLEKTKQAVEGTKQLPERMRKALKGKGPGEITKLHNEVLTLTGKTYDELIKMSTTDAAALIKKNIDGKVESALKGKQAVAKAWTDYGVTKSSHQDLLKELKDLKSGNADPIAIGDLEKQIVAAEGNIDAAKSLIKDATQAENVIVKEVSRLEGFMSDPLYMDKWRVVKKLDDGVKNQMTLLGKNDEAVQMFNTELKASQNNLANAIDAKGAFKEGVISDAQKAIDVSATNKSKELAAIPKLQGEQYAKQWDVTRAEEMRARFPKTMSILEKDAKLMSNIKKGTLSVGNALAIIAEKERDKPESELLAELGDTKLEEITIPFERDISDDITEDEDSSIQGAGTKPVEEVVVKEEIKTEDKKVAEEVPAGEVSAMPKIGDALLKGFGTLAAYAPAIYNISRGLEKPDKVDRRFVSPQTKKYQNMSQPQLNMIDDAFNAAVGNARNTSGGMMSNFRSNIEGAWANRIKNTAQVNAFEAERADKVASENINTINVAEQYNQEVAGKADVLDLQSKATTNSFMAQGMKDVADITSRNRADAMALRNQEITRNAINSGREYEVLPDGTIKFTGEYKKSKAEDTTTTVAKTPVTTTAAITPIIQTPKPITPFDVDPIAFGPAKEDYYYNTKR